MPINPSRLQQITDGDMELQKELLGLFFETCTRCMAAMQDVSAGADALWRDAAHEMKGAANTLGFDRIGRICLKVQETPELSPEVKRAIISELEPAIAEVREFAAGV